MLLMNITEDFSYEYRHKCLSSVRARASARTLGGPEKAQGGPTPPNDGRFPKKFPSEEPRV
eukprot:8401167-Karenia_brevis.AAC.1